MSIFNWFTGLFSDTSAGSENVTDVGHDSISSVIDDSAINPSSDVVMVGGEVGFDVAGNTYGADFSLDSLNINENAINPANVYLWLAVKVALMLRAMHSALTLVMTPSVVVSMIVLVVVTMIHLVVAEVLMTGNQQ